MTTLDHIIALETERTRLYAQQDLPLHLGMQRARRLEAIAHELNDLWKQRRLELAQRNGVSANAAPQAKGRWT